MIIEKITAEDLKYFTNETTLSMIEKAGGMKAYVKMFLTHAKSSKKCAPQFNSLRVNGELIEHTKDYSAQIENAIEANEKLVAVAGSSDDADLIFVYTALSDMDHTYFLTKDGNALPGLECDDAEFFIEGTTITYLSPILQPLVKCDGLDFSLINEEGQQRSFSYPEVAVYVKNSATPLVTINFWDDEVIDCMEPEEVNYFEDISVLAEDIAGKLSALKTKVEAYTE